jgi:uncharacterized protein YceK
MHDRTRYGSLFAIRFMLMVLAVSTALCGCASVHCSTEGADGSGHGGCRFEEHFTTY